MLKSLLNGLKHTAITLAVIILTAVVAAIGNFHPTDTVSIAIWGVVGSLVVGGLTAVIHWLQNKDNAPTA